MDAVVEDDQKWEGEHDTQAMKEGRRRGGLVVALRNAATTQIIVQAQNALLFEPPGVGKTRLAIALGHAAIQAGHSALFVAATSLLAALSKAHAEGHFGDQLGFFAKPS